MVRLLSDQAACRWEADEALLAEIAPDLRLVMPAQARRARLVGTLPVRRPDGRVVDFDVEIRYPGLDPRELPDAYDPARRFVPDADRHVEADGRFCLWVPETAPRREFRLKGGLAVYLCRVQEFLTLQLRYEARRKHGVEPHWPGEAWGHGDDGHREWFEQTTADQDAAALQRLLGAVRHPGKPGRRCPCGSGRRLGHCHKKWLRTVRRVWQDRPATRAVAYEVLEMRRAASSPP